VVLGAEVQEHECTVTRSYLDDVPTDELVARSIEPLKILEEQNRRFPNAAGTGEAAGQVEKLPLARLRTKRRSRPLRIRHAEELEHERQPLSERLIE
jgi:hypothetical protein